MIPKEKLYLPDKYKVWLGEGSSIGFCTLWNEPEKIIKEHPKLLKKIAIVGTLYSRQGVNIILRNLALNPQISSLYLWNYGNLSCSPFGVSGKEILQKLWQNGINDERIVVGTDFKIEKEIDTQVVEKIINNVSLIEVSEPDIAKVIDEIKDTLASPYMESVSFAEAVPEVVDVFPSEKIGFVVRGKTVVEAWTRVLDRIMRYGSIKGTQYGTQQRELIGVTWVIEDEDPDNPSIDTDWPSSLKQTVGLNIESINHYKSVFLSPDTPEGVKYTYGNRLMRYPIEGGSVDQVKEVIERELKDSIDTRRAIATTLVPAIDKDSKEPPCITQIQFLQTDKKLHMLVTARSHDIFKAAIPNAFGLRALQKKIAMDVGMSMGCLQITSQSAHIYEGEWEDAKKLVECAIWEREPSKAFDPAISADPRGMFVISTKDEKISAYFKTPSGDDLLTISGMTAMEVAKKIAQLELIILPEHLLDIGAELQKAEIAITLKLPYVQDKPLLIESVGKEEKDSTGGICVEC